MCWGGGGGGEMEVRGVREGGGGRVEGGKLNV